jgi:high-affinity Fe2+/Pb2+ permease
MIDATDDDRADRPPAPGAPDGSGPTANAITDRDGGPTFWIATVVGWAIIVLGIRMGLNDREFEPASLARWVAGGLIVHDAIWLTAVAIVGALIAYALRGRVPVVIGWALATTAVLTVIAWPFVRGYGRRADLPSALQRNYARGLLAYIAVTWLLALAVLAVGRIRRARRAAHTTTPDAADR